MYKKGVEIAITTAVYIAALLFVVLVAAVIYSSWATRNECEILQNNCGLTKRAFCELWIINGTKPHWPSDLKTGQMEGSVCKKPECTEPTKQYCEKTFGRKI